MDQNFELMIGALARSVSGKGYGMPEGIDWERFLFWAQRHDVCSFLYDVLKKELEVWGQVPEQCRLSLRKEYMQAIYWDAQRDYIREQLGQRLVQAQVPHVFLKGICHLAHHFVCGGVGIRFITDVWVCRNLREPQPDRATVERELERMELLEFARNIEALVGAVW